MKIIYIISLLSLNFIFSQKSKEVKVCLIDGVVINNANYYLLSKSKTDTLIVKNSKLIFSYDENQEEMKILVEYDNKRIQFYIRPNEIHYLKINRMPFRMNNFFKRKYVISQGLEYLEIVKKQN